MRRFDWTLPRILFLPVLLAFTLTTSCTTVTTVHPLCANNAVLKGATEIVVVDREGNEHVFVSAHIEGETFYGLDDQNKQQAIDLSQISYMTVEQLSTKKTLTTIGMVTLSALGGIVVAATVLAAIASCPEVYCYDGKTWVLNAEPYSGAVGASCQRIDHAVLPGIKPCEGSYRLAFRCRAGELDFTDEVKLLVVDADSTLEVLSEEDGTVFALDQWELPLSAVSGAGEDVRSRMDRDGGFFWEGDPAAGYPEESSPREELYLTFKRPGGAGEARFLLRGNNTLWGMHLMGEFLSRFGSSAQRRLDRLDSDPAGREKLENFMKENGVWMEVQVRKGDGWETIGHIRDVGSAQIVKTQSLRIPLPQCEEETLDIRLRWGPLFWNVMKLGIDYGIEADGLSLQEIEATEAVDSRLGDISTLIRQSDGQYYSAEPGDEAVLSFAEPPRAPGLKRTVILKTSGYYNLVLPEDRGAGLFALMMHIAKGKGIDAYSLERLREAMSRREGT